jgi:hypothetical protein
MKLLLVGLLAGTGILNAASASVATNGSEDWARAGHIRFEQCEFKGAARAFSKALQLRPQDADLYHWLGKSYARMAEVASPLGAAGHARHARWNLERAVELEPRNHEYLRELFDFYLDSPEWFSGGLGRAATLVERLEPGDPGAQAFLRSKVDRAGQEYSGVDWRFRQATLVPSEKIGRVIR